MEAAKPKETNEKYPDFLGEILNKIKNKEPSVQQKTNNMLYLIRQNMAHLVARYMSKDLFDKFNKLKVEKEEMQEMLENISIELEAILDSIEGIKQKQDFVKKLKQSTNDIKQLKKSVNNIMDDQKLLHKDQNDNVQKISQLKVNIDGIKP